jgi:hypothetical protein
MMIYWLDDFIYCFLLSSVLILLGREFKPYFLYRQQRAPWEK